MLPLLLASLVSAPAEFHPEAHSHNDYEHARPFHLAYENGFASYEADVFLVEGDLKVAHDREDIKPERTLKSLYLEPMTKAAKANNGWLFKPGQQVVLMVDIKADGAEAWKVLRTQAMQYPELFATHGRGPVRIVVSGDRPRDLIFADPQAITWFDGRASDLETPGGPIHMISENWRSHFTNVGMSPFKQEEKEKLLAWTGKAHALKRKVRFWATPESEKLWETLLETGVDYIGTDKPEVLNRFLTKRKGRLSGSTVDTEFSFR